MESPKERVVMFDRMTPEEFKRHYIGEFVISEREEKLLKRVEQYYKDTHDVGFRTSEQEARSLKAWCDDNGYSKKELNLAKCHVDVYLKT